MFDSRQIEAEFGFDVARIDQQVEVLRHEDERDEVHLVFPIRNVEASSEFDQAMLFREERESVVAGEGEAVELTGLVVMFDLLSVKHCYDPVEQGVQSNE